MITGLPFLCNLTVLTAAMTVKQIATAVCLEIKIAMTDAKACWLLTTGTMCTCG